MSPGFVLDLLISQIYFNLSGKFSLPLLSKNKHKLFKYKQQQMKYRSLSMDSIAILENIIFKIYTRFWFKFHPNQTYIDIGGHIGTFSITSVLKSPGSHCYSYEPASDTYAILNQNVILNRLHNNIKTHKMAVSIDAEPIYLNKHNFNPGSNSTADKTNFHNISEKVSCTTLDSILKDNHITECNLLKIDCEGSEYEILSTSSPGTLNKIKNICMEYHLGSEFMPKMTDLLLSNGFRVWSLPGNNIFLKPFFNLPLIFASKES